VAQHIYLAQRHTLISTLLGRQIDYWWSNMAKLRKIY